MPAASDSMKLCCYCQEPVKPGYFYREVKGWEKLRAGGGANQIHLRVETGRVACQACVNSGATDGVEQGTLI